jgi:hypothetical protein
MEHRHTLYEHERDCGSWEWPGGAELLGLGARGGVAATLSRVRGRTRPEMIERGAVYIELVAYGGEKEGGEWS